MSVASPKSATSVAALPAPRAFGADPDDLSLEMARLPRPALTTALLARCGAVPGSDPANCERNAWNLPLGTRIAQLLRLVAATTDEEELTAMLSCAECQRPFEIALPIAELLRDSPSPAEPNVVPFATTDGRTTVFRRPTGHDQAEWQGRTFATEHEAVAAMVANLAGGDAHPLTELTAADVPALAAALEHADPLVAFSVQTSCPHCGTADEIAVDLEALALERLKRYRRSLLVTVHRLASQYGWTESEILALPADRRREYRELIEDAP